MTKINEANLSARSKRTGIPVALMFCQKCHRWLEARDGTVACTCRNPRVVQG